jgi:cytochrome c553
MRPRATPGRLLAVLWTACLAPAAPCRETDPLPAPAAGRVDFAKDVRPIVQAFCVGCHGATKQKGGLRLDSRAAALRGGAVVPGKGADSPLVRRVAGLGDEARMPPQGKGLTRRQIALLRAWIDQGAAWPASAAGQPAGGHWAYRRLARPAVPAVKDRAALANPIDAFVQARLEAAHLSPAPPADRRTLIRRATYDLLGLPPSPAEVRAFLDDRRPGAWERVVDRLLASPAFGERYARHWLDVVHFAETHGHDQDVPRENAWPYRDYLIRAFNSDLPYARFVEQQVAGDVLTPDDPAGVVALGMLAAGPWDESSQQSIRDDTLDKKQAQNLDRDDVVTTVLSAFSGATVHCARCHDHKFDPITQEEYYGLQAVFAGVDRANRPYDPDPAVHRLRLALESRLRNPDRDGLQTAAVAARVRAWEEARRAAAWHVVTPAAVGTLKGSLAATLPDGSVRFGGPRPAVDVYTITAATPLEHVAAVRLELLTDDSLPHRGPGRQDNGNLHLNEFTVRAGSRGAAEGALRPAALAGATADFDQAGWTAAMAIDGKPATAWGIYPAVGRPHHAVFRFKEPVHFTGGVTLRFTLEQTHGGGHLIGRLRLSVSRTAPPADATPPAVLAVLAVPREKRTARQKRLLARHVVQAEVQAALAALPPRRMVYAAAGDFQPVASFRPAGGCRPVAVLRRGDIRQPLARAVPRALGCVPDLPATLTVARPDDEGARRAALARWLSDRRNVLTWRSIANRVWHYHFGRGIVATPGDLGKMGAAPSHPELLDWLAVELRDGGGSLKKLHRLVLASAAYRRSCRHDPAAARVDADNLLLWRMNRTRLDAESVRDAVQSVSGTLDRRMGGPSDKQFVKANGIHVTPTADYTGFDVDSPAARRRSVYRFVFRTLPDPFFDVLDCPDASQFAPARATSVTALQALTMLNDRFMVRQAEHFAGRLRAEAGEKAEGQVRRAYLLALGRPATARETALLADYARRHGLAAACRVVLNCNEFVFVD